MKQQKYGPLPVLGLTLGGGAVGFVLRWRMLAAGQDSAGLQLSGSWTYISLWILSALVLAGLAFLCWSMGDRAGLEENLKASYVSGGSTIAAAAGIFICYLLQLLEGTDPFGMIVGILGLAGASALAVSGYLRLSGKASAPVGMLVCLSFAARLMGQFRHWSSDPLLGDYCFELLACVFVMLAAYQLAGFSLGKGRRRASIFCTMAAVYFCLVSLADGGLDGCLFYGGAALWLLTGGCTLNRPARRRRKLGGGFVDEPEHGGES